MTNNTLVTSRTLAEYLGVTRRSVKRYTAAGLIEPADCQDSTYLWNLEDTVRALHKAGRCEKWTPA